MDEDSSHIDRLTRWAIFDIVHLLIYIMIQTVTKRKDIRKRNTAFIERCVYSMIITTVLCELCCKQLEC